MLSRAWFVLLIGWLLCNVIAGPGDSGAGRLPSRRLRLCSSAFKLAGRHILTGRLRQGFAAVFVAVSVYAAFPRQAWHGDVFQARVLPPRRPQCQFACPP